MWLLLNLKGLIVVCNVIENFILQKSTEVYIRFM